MKIKSIVNMNKMEVLNAQADSIGMLQAAKADKEYVITGHAFLEKEDGTNLLILKTESDTIATTSKTVIETFTLAVDGVEKYTITAKFIENNGKRTYYTITIVDMDM
ncbi:MAG: hypothetical protein K2G70_07610 [Turicibacter sp.]|nr:hypothetical protein [Turicibacter sp.]